MSCHMNQSAVEIPPGTDITFHRTGQGPPPAPFVHGGLDSHAIRDDVIASPKPSDAEFASADLAGMGDRTDAEGPFTLDLDAGEVGRVADLPAKPMSASQIPLTIERAQLREQALRSRVTEEMAALARTLVAAVSHDLRTPLASIKASSSTLADPELHISAEASRRLATLIDIQADRLTELVQNLLDMSRIQAGVLQPRRAVVSLADLVCAVVGEVTPGPRGHAIRVELPGDLPPLNVDVTLISRVLTNLLENSIRHGPKHSTITIGGALANLQTVVAYVADQGPGLRPEGRDELFELFARRPGDAGAGLGLTIAKTFVEAHGQRIWVEAAPGGGARFCFTLPVAALVPDERNVAGLAPEELKSAADSRH
jgi:two-component system, OmpR family, sensor histidine kinase KdpD